MRAVLLHVVASGGVGEGGQQEGAWKERGWGCAVIYAVIHAALNRCLALPSARPCSFIFPLLRQREDTRIKLVGQGGLCFFLSACLCFQQGLSS